MMHSVPKTLHGATLGKAHQWVRSITDTREYALENPDGERISLADLTNGSTVEVRVIGEVKQNPAHPAAFTGRSFGMNRHVSLTHILPEEVKPALVSSMVREQGLFGAVQSLSILMARPLKEFVPTSPMAEEILRARFYDYEGTALPLRNPAPAGLGRSYGGRLLGEEIAAKDAAMYKYVKETIESVDSIEVTEAEMQNFVNNSLAPFLLAAEANRRAISYIRRYILPVAKDLGIRGKSLNREFEYMVKHMATDPADFYHGKEFAIVAHPAFLFPQFGVMALPVPSGKSDSQAIRMIDDLFSNAGNPPRFEGGTFIRRDSKAKKEKEQTVQFLGDYLLGGAKTGDPLDWEFVKDRMKKFDLGSIIRSVAMRLGESTADLSGDSGAFVAAYQELKGKDRKAIMTAVSKERPPSLFVMDLLGMRPRPVDWPDALVLSAMEVLGKYRAGVKESDVLSIEFGQEFELEAVTFEAKDSSGTKKEVTLDFKDLATSGAAAMGKFGGTITLEELVQQALKSKQPTVEMKSLTLTQSDVSVTDMMVEAVSLAITKHGYESDEEDIRFVTALMLLGVKKVRGATGIMETDGIASTFAKLAKESANEDREAIRKAIDDLVKNEDSPAGAIVALLALKKAFKESGP